MNPFKTLWNRLTGRAACCADCTCTDCRCTGGECQCACDCNCNCRPAAKSSACCG